MDQIFEGYDAKYVLTKDEVMLISEYADLDNDGKVLSSILKSVYLSKNDLYKGVLKSIKIFAYYDTFDYYNKRNAFKEVFLNYYLKEKDAKLVLIKKVQELYGKNSSRYKIALEELASIDKAINYGGNIDLLDDNRLNRLIANFYDVKYCYYEWYLKMQLREEYQKGVVFDKHLETVIDLHGDINALNILNQQNQEDLTKALNISKILNKFLEQFIDFDFDQFDDFETRGIFSRKKNDNNLDVLYKVFSELVRLYGVELYLKNNFNINDKEHDRDKKIFDIYFRKNYGDITYVSIDSFIKRFKRCIISYYKKLLLNYDNSIKNRNDQLDSFDLDIKAKSDSSLVQARLIEQIYRGYDVNQSFVLKGFSAQESEEMYDVLKSYVENGFTFEKENLEKKKV
jgi:hypothetical protein